MPRSGQRSLRTSAVSAKTRSYGVNEPRLPISNFGTLPEIEVDAGSLGQGPGQAVYMAHG